jgi:hypothetical protein
MVLDHENIARARLRIKALERQVTRMAPSPSAAAFASAREHRRLMQKGVVVNLLDEEIRHVGRSVSLSAYLISRRSFPLSNPIA